MYKQTDENLYIGTDILLKYMVQSDISLDYLPPWDEVKPVMA